MKSSQSQSFSAAFFTMQAVRCALLLSLLYGHGGALQSGNMEASLRTSEEGPPNVHSADAIRGAYGVASRPLTGQLAHPPAPWLFDQLRLLMGRAMRPLLEIRRPAEHLTGLHLAESSSASGGPVHSIPEGSSSAKASLWISRRLHHSFPCGSFFQLKAILGFLLPWQSMSIQVPAKSSSTMMQGHEQNSTLMLLKHHRTEPWIEAPGMEETWIDLKGFWTSTIGTFWILAGSSYAISAMLCVGVWWWFFTAEEETRHVSGKLQQHKSSFMMADDTDDSDSDEDSKSDTSRASYRKAIVRKGRTRGFSALQMNAARDAYLEQWMEESQEESYRTGALTLAILGVLLLCFEVTRLLYRPSCARPNWLVHGPELAVLSILIVKTMYCVYEPKKWLYWVGVGFYFGYIPAVMLPPFQMSCTELFDKCGTSDNWFIKEQVSHVNCSLQGQTSQQVLMTVFLLLPWLLPKHDMMYFTLVWLVGVYVFWTMTYRELIDEGFYSTSDVIIRLLLLSGCWMLSFKKKEQLEKTQMNQWISDRVQETAKRRLMGVFTEMLPPHVIPRVYNNGTCSDEYQTVSIMFVLIEDFDGKFVSQMEARHLLDFLNGVFSQFDKICADRGVTKIETVQEEFVCCVGVTPEHVNEAKQSGGHEQLLGCLFEAAGDMLELQTEKMKLKMGIHTGKIVAGVVGQKLPRYRLIGDTINTAARMMQTGPAGQVQFGVETKGNMPGWVTKYTQDRGLIVMKGKGNVQTYLFSNKEDKSGTDSSQNAASDSWGFGSLGLSLHASAPSEASASITPADRSHKRRVSFDEDVQAPLSSVKAIPIKTGLLKRLLKGSRLMDSSASTPSDHMESAASQGLLKSSSHVSDGMAMESIEAQLLADDIDNAKSEEPSTASGFARVAARLFPEILSERKGFTQEMEEDLRKEHHETFMKKMVPNTDKIILVVLLMTLVEAMFMVYTKIWLQAHDYFPGHGRLTLFIASRLLVLAILIYFRIQAAQATWAFTDPLRFQWAVVGGLCATVILYFFSYDALTTGHHQKSGRWKAPVDQVFSLLFMLQFFTIIRWKFRFSQSLSFVGLAAVIWMLILIRELNGVYFPYLGQVLFFGLAIANAVLAHQEEQSIRARYKAQCKTRQMKRTINQILETMMPPLVLKGLRSNLSQTAAVHDYKFATIAQSDLCGFTALASTRTASEVVELIGEIFNRFDDLTDSYGIYKVETVGDAYIAGMAEKPLTQHNSPRSVVEFGKAMVQVVNEWSKGKNLNVRCRVGVHHGTCVGGIVGMNQQRYHLFGKLLVGLEVLESTAPEGGVQVSRMCKEAVDAELNANGAWCVERKEDKLVTSKGHEHKFEEVGGRTWVITGI